MDGKKGSDGFFFIMSLKEGGWLFNFYHQKKKKNGRGAGRGKGENSGGGGFIKKKKIEPSPIVSTHPVLMNPTTYPPVY
ncbi:hypothetical protein BLX88_20505 [Bacillus obstructivus]|nr:hypothetical protein BLX88_20505 [Bacillus obstructivus]